MLKNKSTIYLSILILTTFILFGFKIGDTDYSNYYYYQGSPYYLDQVSNSIFIELNSNLDESALNNLISSFPELKREQIFNLNQGKDFVFLDTELTSSDFRNLINILNRRHEVLNASPVFKVQDGKGNPNTLIGVEKEIIAQFKASVSDNEIDSYLNNKGMQIIQEFDLSGGKSYLIKIPDGEYSIDYANELYISGLVNYSEPNLFFTNLLNIIPNDPLFSQQWSHRNTGNNIPGGITGTAGCDMRTDSAWIISMGSPNVIVSIVDTGIDTLHEDLSSRIINGLSIDTYNNLPYAWDDQNHGTACAGIVAATGNNNLGVIGVAPMSRLFGVKIFNSAGNTNSTAIINGMIAAWQRGSWVSSNSWGGGSPISAADNAILDGVNLGRNGKGVLWSFATGNGNSALSWPSTNTNVLSVGGLSPCNQRKSTTSCDNETWWGANYGTGLEIVAPAVKIYTTDRSGTPGYTTGNYVPDFNGTSSATPNASGVAALILAVDSSLTWQQVRERICSTADKVGSYTYNQPGQLGLGGWNNEMGYGKINAYKALVETAALMGPTISHTPLPNTEQITGNYIVNCSIIPNGSALVLSELKLLWSKDNVSITDSVVLANTGGNNFTGNILSTGAGQYRYYIKAGDELNRTTTSPFGAPANLFSFVAAIDVIAPTISHTALGNVALIRWPVGITAQVTDNLGVGTVEGEIRVNGGSVTTFPMPNTSGNTYQGMFPSLTVEIGDMIEYRIKATDNSSQSNVAYNPASGYHMFNIIDTRGLVLVLDDDVTLAGRESNEKGGVADYVTPLGVSAALFTSTLNTAGFTADQFAFGSVDTSIFSGYDVIILSAGIKESSILSNAAVRAAIVRFTQAGGKTLAEGGEVGYAFRKSGTTIDLDPPFRREVLNDSAWVSDRINGNIAVTNPEQLLFNDPNSVPSSVTVTNGGSSGWGARDEVTILPGKPGVRRLANWSNTTTAANGSIIVYHPGNDTTKMRNIFFAFAVSQISPSTVAEALIENAVEQLMKDITIPVELTSFTASVIDNQVQLNWLTATEVNNSGFEVERKAGAGSFEKVGFIPGFGTTTELRSYSFVDQKVGVGLYSYRLKQVDFNGTFAYSEEVNVEVNPPLVFALEQNYPNPFNPSTMIKYSIPQDGFVNLFIYNLLGEKVATLVNSIQKAGRYEVNFDASRFASGVYFYSIEAGSYKSVKKMLLMK